MRDVSNFFGYSLTEEQVQRIAEGSTFSAMKQKATDSHSTIGPVIFRKGDATSPDQSEFSAARKPQVFLLLQFVSWSCQSDQSPTLKVLTHLERMYEANSLLF